MLRNGLNIRSFCEKCSTRNTVTFGFGEFHLADIIMRCKCEHCGEIPRIDKIKFRNCTYSYDMIDATNYKRTKSKRIIASGKHRFPQKEARYAKLQFNVEALPPDVPSEECSDSDDEKSEEKGRNKRKMKKEEKEGENDMSNVEEADDDGKTFHMGSMSFLDGLDFDVSRNVNQNKESPKKTKSRLMDDQLPTPGTPLLRDQLSPQRPAGYSPQIAKKIGAEEFNKPKEEKHLSKHEIDDSEIQTFKLLGEGSYGKVFSARWNGSGGGDEVAVKEIAIMIGGEDNTKQSIMNEFQTIMDMNYRRIVRVFGFTLSPGKIRIVMDLMDGDVGMFVRKKKDLTLYDKFELMHKMTQGLNYLHSKGVIHRDVKSFNFLQRDHGREVVVTDFGLALTLQQSKSHQTGKFKGTVRWMAPELMVENPKYKTSCDIYAMGITYWEVVFEEVPFRNQHNDFVLMNLIRSKDLKPTMTDPTLPRPLKGLILACLNKNPAERPSSEELIKWFEHHRQSFRKKYNKVMKFKTQ